LKADHAVTEVKTRMEYVYAALLLHASKQKISEESLEKVLKSAGTTPDKARVQALVAALSEVNIDEAIKAAPGIVAAPPAAAAPAPEKKEEQKPEKKEEKEAEAEAIQGLGALFR
jgi:large subunit ribosomal protein L12